MRILLTGATGFLGRSVLPRLAGEHEVIAVHRPGTAPAGPDGMAWVEQDLAASLEPGLPDRLDAVVHLAQSPHYRDPGLPLDVFELNAAATVRLLDLCRRAGGARFVFASSGSVYAPGPDALSEDDPPAPGDLYAASKLAGEGLSALFGDELAFNALRFFFIYGPGQNGRMVPGIVERLRSGRAVSLAGEEGIRVNPVFVDDAADAVVAALSWEGSGTVNVAGPEVVSIRALAEAAAAELGVDPRFQAGNEGADLVASIERLRSLGVDPAVGVREGLRRTISG